MTLRSRSTVLLLACLAPSPALLAQQLLYEIRGQGAAVTPIGDLDGDGATDFLAGRVRGYSGRTGELLLAMDSGRGWNTSIDLAANVGDVTGDGVPDLILGAALYSGSELRTSHPVLQPTPPVPHFVFDVPPGNMGILGGIAVLDDLNGDGLPEVLFGWPDVMVTRCPSDHIRIQQGTSGGAVRICSSLDGSVLRERVEATGSGTGGVVARLGDLDADGIADYAVGTRQVSEHPFFCQLPGDDRVRVHSGKSGAVLWERSGTPRALVPVGDVNRDGVNEVALGFPHKGRVEVRSGVDGSLLRSNEDPLVVALNLFGHALAPAGDLFGSGSPTLFVAAPQPWVHPIGVPGNDRSAGPGAVLLFSLGRRPRMFAFSGAATGDEYGAGLAFLGDVNGDGRPEVAIGSTYGAPNGVIRVESLDLLPRPGGGTPLPGRPQKIHR